MIPTLKTSCNDVAVVVKDPNELISLRRLTPRECWRLMGWKDEDIDKVMVAYLIHSYIKWLVIA